MPKHFQIRREVYIGVIVIAVFGLFLWGITFLKNNTLFHKHAIYVGIYDRVNGLVVDNPVLINGLKVGKVKELGFLPNKGNKVFVKIMMLQNIQIPANSIMIVTSSDLLGAKAVEIELSKSGAMYKSGDTLKTASTQTLQEEVTMQVLPIKKKTEQLLSSIDSLITNIQTILNTKTRDNLRNSFENIRGTLQNIEQTSYNVDTLVITEKNRMIRIIQNVEAITGNIKNNDEKLNHIIDNFSSITDTLTKFHLSNTINNLNRTLINLSEITDKINKGHGSLGMLINNDSLYNRLQSSSDDLDKLLEDIRLNPRRYVHISVFGGGAKKDKYTPPAKQ